MTPTASLDVRYSDPEATATPWADTLAHLAEAELAWIVTVRPDGRPHATPMVPVVVGEKVCFHTGTHEVKAANLRANPNVLVLAGDTAWDRGLDVMVEGVAAPVTDRAALERISESYRARWDGRWRLDVDVELISASAPDVEIVVYEVTPTKVRGHVKGDPFGQTTYLFTPEEG